MLKRRPRHDRRDRLRHGRVSRRQVHFTGGVNLDSGDLQLNTDTAAGSGAINFTDGNELVLASGVDIQNQLTNFTEGDFIDLEGLDESGAKVGSSNGVVTVTSGSKSISLNLTVAGEALEVEADGDGTLLHVPLSQDLSAMVNQIVKVTNDIDLALGQTVQITAAPGGVVDISGDISDLEQAVANAKNVGLELSGGGTIELTGDNTFNDEVRVDAATTLAVNSTDSVGDSSELDLRPEAGCRFWTKRSVRILR